MFLLQNLSARLTDQNNNVCAGALMYTYITGTTTPKVAYQDQAGTTPHANPIVASSDGLFPQVWLNSDVDYRIKITKSDGTTALLGTPWDGVSGNNSIMGKLASAVAGLGSALVAFLQVGVNAVLRTVQAKLQEKVSIEDFGAIAQTGLDNTNAINACITACIARGAAMEIPARAVPFEHASTLVLNYDATNVQSLRVVGKSGLFYYPTNRGSMLSFVGTSGYAWQINGAASGWAAPTKGRPCHSNWKA